MTDEQWKVIRSFMRVIVFMLGFITGILFTIAARL